MPASSFEVHRLGEVDSTNDWLLAAARDDAPDRTVAVASFQRRGKGRLDRRWEAPPGTSLLCSVLLREPLAPKDRHLATVAAGLAGLGACRSAAGLAAGPTTGLKWPNDLVADDRKLGGILAETDGVADASGAVALVVGLGINLTWSGPDEATGTSLLAATGQSLSADDLLTAYLAALATRADSLSSDEGRDELVRDYLDELVTVGRTVRVELHDGVVVGVARGVTDAGHLVVETPDGLRVVAAGDVVHLRAAVEGASGTPG